MVGGHYSIKANYYVLLFIMQISAQTPAARWAEIRRGGGLDVARAFVSSGYYQAVHWEKKPMTVTVIYSMFSKINCN